MRWRPERRRAAPGWGQQGEAWRDWLHRSPRAAELLTWWQAPTEHARLVGPDGYWAHVLGLLHTAEPRDCAAAGLGCQRRNDRPCRDPAVCAQDPPVAGGLPGVGPTPGGCDGFYGYLADVRTYVQFSADRRHRAVLWWPAPAAVQLWVDGVRFAAGVPLDSSGAWVADRFFAIAAEGPGGHPGQHYGPGVLVSRILSLLVCDALRGTQRLLHPLPTEQWTSPRISPAGDALLVYPDQAALDADRPDREVPLPADPPDAAPAPPSPAGS